ncbi:hypothetical protein G7046_g4124 [Stylonectria norvegica]|nr:hypothetical protein G7046_g4124 [Stylonectria norvegica]
MDSEKSLHHHGSQESFVYLDPAPMETPPADLEKNVDWSTEESMESSASTILSGTTGPPGLSGSGLNSPTGPGAIYYLMRIQRLSSYAMGFFTSLHLANVSLIPAITRSVAGSETYLLMTREIYQTSLTEPILVALPVLAHIGSGIALRVLRRSRNTKRYGDTSLWPPVSYISMSGYAFTVFYTAHAFVNRILPLQVEGDSSNIGLAYVAHGFARHPVIARIAYIGLIVVGCSHMIWGQAKWLGIAPSTNGWQGSSSVGVDKATKKQRRRKWIGIHGAALGLAALWAVGGLAVVARGGLTDGWIGKVYDNLFATVGL